MVVAPGGLEIPLAYGIERGAVQQRIAGAFLHFSVADDAFLVDICCYKRDTLHPGIDSRVGIHDIQRFEKGGGFMRRRLYAVEVGRSLAETQLLRLKSRNV